MEYIISNAITEMKNENENEKTITIDDCKIKNIDEFEKILKEIYLNANWPELFNENTKVHIKLKINLREYLILTNMLFPTFIKPINR
jgi:hypothetical protein